VLAASSSGLSCNAVKKSADAMIAAANRTIYGLGAAIFTRDSRHARAKIAPRLQAGMVFINHAVRSHVAVPFGGSKASGLGRELGRPGVLAFTNPKTIWTVPPEPRRRRSK
jgi:acyl-CoA reductase-like NAD-dependent aldehyde dehydrogenase